MANKKPKTAGNKAWKEAAKKYRWKKGDPRASEAGKKSAKKLPALRALMTALLGGEDGTPPEQTPMAEIVRALIKETKNTKIGAQRVAAAKEVLDRAFGKVKDADKMEEGESEAKKIITGFTIKRK